MNDEVDVDGWTSGTRRTRTGLAGCLDSTLLRTTGPTPSPTTKTLTTMETSVDGSVGTFDGGDSHSHGTSEVDHRGRTERGNKQ